MPLADPLFPGAGSPITAGLSMITAPSGTSGIIGAAVGASGNTLVTEPITGSSAPPLFEGGGGSLVTDLVNSGVSAALGAIGGNDLSNIDYRPLPFRWLERVQNYSPWNDVFSMEQQETSLVIDIPFENRYYFIPYCLGFAWVENGRLKRLNPIQHPYWSWMRACRVGHIGVRYAGSKVFTTALGTGSQFGSARYKLARFTVAFANYPWEFLEDSEITNAEDEWQRNVYWEEQPTAQMLAAEGGASTLRFAYGSADGPPADSAPRAQFGTPVGQIRYVLHWKHVPYDYVFYNRVPTNLYNAIMKLNATEAFDTHPAGTCLFEPPQIVKYVYPVRTRESVAYMCDISIPYIYMNPPRGITSGEGSEIRGHNLLPYRRNNLWYPAMRADNTGNAADKTLDSDGNPTKGLFAYTDWKKIFTRPTNVE